MPIVPRSRHNGPDEFSRSIQLVKGDARSLEHYQSDRPLGAQEKAFIWRHTALEGVEVLRGLYKTYQAARHFHTVTAIGLVARGAMTSYCRGGTHTLAPGTVFLINPEEVHAPGPVIPDGWILRALYFDDQFFEMLSANFGTKALRFSQLFVQDRALSSALQAFHDQLEVSSTTLELESTLLAALGRIADKYACEAGQQPKPRQEVAKVNRVREYLHAYYGQNIVLADLAVVAEFSPYHLLRTFKRCIGLTPQAYLTQIRIDEARRLLRSGRAIADVAGETGFADQAHLNRHFRRIMGVTPGQYLPRRRVRTHSR